MGLLIGSSRASIAHFLIQTDRQHHASAAAAVSRFPARIQCTACCPQAGTCLTSGIC